MFKDFCPTFTIDIKVKYKNENGHVDLPNS
jgi:hypothetical protein